MFHRRQGVTLVELLIAIAMVGIGVLASVGSYRYYSMSIQHSKGRTLANNLAQEQVEKLKNLSYYTLLVTTATNPGGDTRFSPPLSYDIGNYTPQTLVEGGMTFTRATRVDFVTQTGGVVTPAPWTSDDTALKQITVYVIWQEGTDWRYFQTTNLMANPAANPLNSTFKGTVTNAATLLPISGALIRVLDNPNWFAYTDAAGQYRFNVSEGSYTIECSTRGYYTKDAPGAQVAISGSVQTLNFALTAVATGTLVGTVYTNTHLLVSQVVVSTDTGGSAEYVELFNPTTTSMLIASGGTAAVNLYVFDNTNNTVPNPPLLPVPLTYVHGSVPAHSYYLIANTTTVHAGGASLQADAYYTGITSHLISQSDAGGVGIADLTPSKIDAVSWSRNSSFHSCPVTPTEGTCISSAQGILPGEQLIRFSDPGGLITGHGNAYDSNDNSHDFKDYPSLTVAPHNTVSATQNPTAGTPATGAVVNANDPVSIQTTCTDSTLPGGYRVASFSLPGVATGTWIVDISTGSYFSETTNVISQVNVTTGIPNGITSPAWVASGSTSTLLSDTTIYALVSGLISNANGSPLSGIEVTDGNGHSVFSSASGRYLLLASTGAIQLTANPSDNNQNRAYTIVTHNVHTLSPGGLYDETSWAPLDTTDSSLSLAGVLRGYFQTGSGTQLPGRVAVALVGGNQMAQGVSDNTGHFYLLNLATGTYEIDPQLDPAEIAIPSSATVVLSSTGSVNSVSTFTVTSALGQITGQVKVAASSDTITTGVLVLASTSTLSGTSTSPPPTMNGSTGILCNPCYYMGSSDALGSYTLDVRSNSNPYKVYGWYTTFSGTTPSYRRVGPYSVSVSTGGQIISQNLSW